MHEQSSQAIHESFDLVFIDADKREYCDYYRLVFDRIPIGGFLLADNVLWDGKVIDPDARGEDQTRRIMEFNDLVQNDPRVRNVILTIRDGIMLIQKIGE